MFMYQIEIFGVCYQVNCCFSQKSCKLVSKTFSALNNNFNNLSFITISTVKNNNTIINFVSLVKC